MTCVEWQGDRTQNYFSRNRRWEADRAELVPWPPVHAPTSQTHRLPSQTRRVWKTWEWVHSPFHKSQKGHLSYRLRIFSHLGTPAVIRVDHKDESRHLAFSPTKCSSVPGEDPIEQAKVVFECGDRIHIRIQFGGCQLCRPSNSARETPGTN